MHAAANPRARAHAKGAVGLFNATRARAVHETLFITNPDREWVLTGANTLKGQQQASRARRFGV